MKGITADNIVSIPECIGAAVTRGVDALVPRHSDVSTVTMLCSMASFVLVTYSAAFEPYNPVPLALGYVLDLLKWASLARRRLASRCRIEPFDDSLTTDGSAPAFDANNVAEAVSAFPIEVLALVTLGTHIKTLHWVAVLRLNRVGRAGEGLQWLGDRTRGLTANGWKLLTMSLTMVLLVFGHGFACVWHAIACQGLECGSISWIKTTRDPRLQTSPKYVKHSCRAIYNRLLEDCG